MARKKSHGIRTARRVVGSIAFSVDAETKRNMRSLAQRHDLEGTELQKLARRWKRLRLDAEEAIFRANQTEAIIWHLTLNEGERTTTSALEEMEQE